MGKLRALPMPRPLRVKRGGQESGVPHPEELKAELWRWLDRIPAELVAGGHSLLLGSWLRALGLHDRYSPMNRGLIAMQAPRTPAVGTESWWERQGREVVPGARPVYVLAYDGQTRKWTPTPVYRFEDTVGEPFAATYVLTEELVEAFVGTLRVFVLWDGSAEFHFDPEAGKLVLGRLLPPEDALEVALVANEVVLARERGLEGEAEAAHRTVALAAATAFLARFGVDRLPTERRAAHDPEVAKRLAAFRQRFGNPRAWKQARKEIEAALGRMEALWSAFTGELEA